MVPPRNELKWISASPIWLPIHLHQSNHYHLVFNATTQSSSESAVPRIQRFFFFLALIHLSGTADPDKIDHGVTHPRRKPVHLVVAGMVDKRQDGGPRHAETPSSDPL